MENNEVVEENNKTLTFDEILASNVEYQKEFDKRMTKAQNTYAENQKSIWEKEFNERLEREKSEAEKLAKMNTEQQLNYRISQQDKTIQELQGKLNAKDLYEATSNILIEKGIPSSYLKMFDFTKENADTINSKVEMLSNIRTNDLEESLNRSLRQSSPKQVHNEPKEEIDPFVEGFLSEL